MLINYFSLRLFGLTKWSFSIHSATHNAPYIHPRLSLILELCWTFRNELVALINVCYGCLCSVSLLRLPWVGMRSSPEVINICSCSTQLSTKFQLLIKTKIPTNKEVSCFKYLRCLFFGHANKC